MRRRCVTDLILSASLGVACVLSALLVEKKQQQQHATAIYSGCLMALIALERLTFKLMVDRMAPFR